MPISSYEPIRDAIAAPADDDGQLIVGTDGDDYLEGSDGDDTLRGLAGRDTLYGGLGDDLLAGGSGNDELTDVDLGSDTLQGGGGDDVIGVGRYWHVPDVSESLVLDGGDGNDLITLVGGYGLFVGDLTLDATIDGGDGDDHINLDFASHAVVDAGAGNDLVEASVSTEVSISLGGGADVLHLKGVNPHATAPLVVTDFETGDAGDRIEIRLLLSQLIPGWEHDNPFGSHLRLVQQGADVMLQLKAENLGADWRDIILFQDHQASDFTAFNLDGFPSDGSEPVGVLIDGSAEGDDLEGTIGGDTIRGLAGDDYLYGEDGRDRLIGGKGNDYLEGDWGRDTLIGGSGNDHLVANAEDRAIGGKGDDYFEVFNWTEVRGDVVLFGGAGSDHFDIELFGSDDGAKVLGGDGDDDIAISSTGHVQVNGGDGDDTISFDDPGQDVKVRLGGGSDVLSIGRYPTAPALIRVADFEAGASGDRLDLADFMQSNFIGWDNSTNPFAAGYLRLVQETDATVVQYSANGDGNWLSLFVLNGVVAGDLTAENLSGYPGDGSDPAGLLIHGTKEGEFLYGGIGPDTIVAGAGYDEIHAGAGNDKLVGGSDGDALYGGYGHDLLIGGEGGDYLIDENGGNTLRGGEGADTLELDFWAVDDALARLDGGDGDDVLYWLSNAGRGQGVVDAGAGDDYLQLQTGTTKVDIFLGKGSDSIWFSGGVQDGGSAHVRDFTAEDQLHFDDVVWWTDNPFGEGALRLAQRGDDTVVEINYASDDGEAHWHELISLDGVQASGLTGRQLGGVHPGPVWLVGGAGHDELSASADFTRLDGAGGADVLTGSAKGDILAGGLGADVLTGGQGVDVFLYQTTADSTVDARDVITDLSDKDVIDLSAVDANVLWWGHQEFVIVDYFTGGGGELVVNYKPASDVTLIQGDTDADGKADFEIAVEGDHSDFVNFVL